jgi:hypothetical protein
MGKIEMQMPKFLQEILDIAEKGDFDAAEPKESVVDGEEVIGEMNSFAKACSVFTKEKKKQAIEMLQAGVSQKNNELAVLMKSADLANDLKWLSVRDQLENGGPDEIGIRKGWQVVEIPQKEKGDDCDCPACQMKRAISGILGDGITIGIGLPI